MEEIIEEAVVIPFDAEVHAEGKKAFRDGVPWGLNPYRDTEGRWSPRSIGWNVGWTEAQQEEKNNGQ